MADHVDALYALPPEEFVTSRDGLAKRLRADGDKDAAAAVKKLPRPTVAAWALNQLPRRRSDVVEELVAAGAELRRAQRRAVSGIRDAGMNAASEQRRDAVRAAARAVAEILAEAGKDPQTAEREISAALEAATIDPETAEELQEGRFAKPPELQSDLSDLMALSLAAVDDAPAPKSKRSDDKPDREAQRREKHQREVAEARQRATAASNAALSAEREAEEAQTAADNAAAEAERLRKDAEEAARRATALARAARDAQQEAAKRRDAAKSAAEKLATLERDG